MPFWVYMLLVGEKSRGYNRKIYTGYTHHLVNRLTQHVGLNSVKGARITRKQAIELAYLERFSSRKQALKREWDFKHTSPLNQKKNKLSLIREFQKNNADILENLNTTFEEHNHFLESMITSLKKIEKEMKTRVQSK
ncbi:MAG: GIY-YIG nuclease family protein [Candidatus Hodarchaeales archaeon]|jgi:predicted GIY-YIG superfamily endonuclease